MTSDNGTITFELGGEPMSGPEHDGIDDDQVEQLMEWCFIAWSAEERERRDEGAKPFDAASFERPLF